MFYNLKYNLCGVWNPKTGSTSMRDLFYRQDFIHNDLQDYADSQIIPKPNSYEIPRFFHMYHITQRDITLPKSPFNQVHIKLCAAVHLLYRGVGKGIFKDMNMLERKAILKNTTFFCAVRNPWSRIVSFSKMRHRVGERIVKNKENITKADEKTSVDLYQKYGDDISKYIPFIAERLSKQSSYWKIKSQNLMQNPCVFNEQEEINMTVMKQENLQEDFNSLCNQIGVKPIALPNSNASVYKNNDKDYRRYFETKENENWIEEIRAREQETIELKSYTYD